MIAESIQDYSQCGEAKTIEAVLRKIPDLNLRCVDVGAGNGFSNTHSLVAVGYEAILFDGDWSECEKLRAERWSDHVVVLNNLVGFMPEDGLDALLSYSAYPSDFDFLSIDIDGNDYHVWAAMKFFQPKVVCIEFNPTIPTEVHFVQKADMDVRQGCSLMALVALGKEKGYELVAVHAFNAIFVRKEYYPLMGVADNDPYLLRTELSYVTWMFTGYDGHIFTAGMERMPWHPIWWDERRLQVLPRYFQKMPWTYSKFQRFLFNTWRWINYKLGR